MENSLSQWLQQILEVLPGGLTYLLVLALIAFFESLPVVGLAMPGSTLVVLAGFLAYHGKGHMGGIILVTTCGALIGDLLSFWLGARFGQPLLTRKSFKKHRQLINQAELFFTRHGGKSIFFARFIGPIRGITPFIAGMARMPGKGMILYATISAILWGLTYPGLGYLGGASWQQAQSWTTRFALLITLGLILTVLHSWLRRSLSSNSGEKQNGN